MARGLRLSFENLFSRHVRRSVNSPKLNRTSLIVASVAILPAALATHVLAQRGSSGENRRGPPPESIAACSALEENASCAFEGRRGEVEGTCFALPNSEELACRPAGQSSAGSSRAGRRGSQGGGSGRGGRSGPPPLQAHSVTQSDGPASLIPATQAPIADSVFSQEEGETWRVIRANGISEHPTGSFPNPGNPNAISEQQYSYRVPAVPKMTGEILPALGQPFGIAVNGVLFDPGANEFFAGNRRGGWQYEPLRDALNLGLDEHHAHVQPSGAYHYHGLPIGLMERLGLAQDAPSPLIGWAADGFPIYALFVTSSAGDAIVEMTSSHTLREGLRPSGADDPGGFYDGTFTRDYEYVAGLGTLDECNGASVVTPEFPRGTYAYFLTADWPVIPRCYKGTPSADFARRQEEARGREGREGRGRRGRRR